MSAIATVGLCPDCGQTRPLYPFTCTCYSTPRHSTLCVRCYNTAALEEEDAQRAINEVAA